MKLNIDEIASLKQKRLTVDFCEEMDIAELEDPGTVSGSITVSINAGGVKMLGTLATVLELTCDVCLQPFVLPLEIDLQEQFVYKRAQVSGTVKGKYDDDEEDDHAYTKEKELNPEDFYEVLPDDKNLDVSDIVYQAVILSLPAFAHCGEGCPGVPLKTQAATQPESGDKIDPRWESLKSLFQNKEN